MEPNINHPTNGKPSILGVAGLSIVALIAAVLSVLAPPDTARAGPATSVSGITATGTTVATTASTFFVAPGGTGSSCTQADPCGFINDAYALARTGDVIKLTAGAHPHQEITAPPADGLEPPPEGIVIEPSFVGDLVRFEGSLIVRAPNLTIRGVRGGVFVFKETADDTVFENAILANGAGQVRIDGADRVTIRNSRITGGTDLDSLQISGGTGHVIERNVIGGVRLSPGSTAHADSIQILGGTDITIRRNIIRGSFAHALFVKPDHSPIERLAIEDNTILRCGDGLTTCAVHISLHVVANANGGPPETTGVELHRNTVVGTTLIREGVAGIDVRDNTFETYNLDVDPVAHPTQLGGCPPEFGTVEDNFIGTTNCPILERTNQVGPS